MPCQHRQHPHHPASEGALQQTVAAAACRTLIAAPEPVHHVTCVSTVSTAETEVGAATNSYVADGALEGQTSADGALRPPSLTTTVIAVHAELWRHQGDTRRLGTGDILLLNTYFMV